MLNLNGRSFGRQKKLTILTVALALSVRLLVFWFGPSGDWTRATAPDSSLYFSLAENLTKTGMFGVRPEQESAFHHSLIRNLRDKTGRSPRQVNGLVPESFRTPGYPAFIAMTSMGLREPRLTLLFQCLLGSICAGLVGITVARLGFSATSGAIAGVIWALHPALVIQDNVFLTESLFNFLVVLAVFLATFPTWFVWSAAGLMLGAAAIVRPPLGYLYLPTLLTLAWTHRPRLRSLTPILACALLPAMLWTTRNWSAGEGFQLSTVGDYNLVFYTAPCVISESRGESCDAAYASRWREIATRLESEVTVGDNPLSVARRDAIRDVAEHPLALIPMYVKSLLKLGVSHSAASAYKLMGAEYSSSGLFARLVLRESDAGSLPPTGPMVFGLMWTLLNGLLAVLAIVGFWRAIRGQQLLLLIAFGPPVLLAIAAVGPLGQERFRLAVMLPLVVLSAIALERRNGFTKYLRASSGNSAPLHNLVPSTSQNEP